LPQKRHESCGHGGRARTGVEHEFSADETALPEAGEPLRRLSLGEDVRREV
jgi:hypothetical protein